MGCIKVIFYLALAPIKRKVLLLAFLNVVIVRYGHVSMELASGHISPFIIAEIAAFAGICNSSH